MTAPLAVPRGPRRLPTATMPNSSKPFGRGVVLSILIHIAVIFALIWRPSVLLEESKTPGGAGPRGGGGGGGSQQISYVRLDFPQSSQSATVQTPAVTVPVLNMPDIKLEDPKINVPEVKMDVSGQIRGTGQGTGGDKGSGTGTGGGIGGGVGTGTGNDRGPGTGGDGGEIFPPRPRFVTMLGFMPGIPRSWKGKRLDIFFSVDEFGHVTDAQFVPVIRDDDLRSRVLLQIKEWTFDPAMTRDGRPTRAVVKISTSL